MKGGYYIYIYVWPKRSEKTQHGTKLRMESLECNPPK